MIKKTWNYVFFILVMIGKQVINILLEFIYVMLGTCGRCMCGKNKHNEEQWEIDHDLYDFNSNILINEYLELGKLLFF